MPPTAQKKGRAPRPQKAADADTSRPTVTPTTLFEVKVRGETVGRLAVGNVPLLEKAEVRRQTGMNWLEVLGEVGAGGDVVTMSVFVWLAKRVDAPALSWREFLADWDDTVRADEILFSAVAADDPEGADDPQP